eukprot:TRINITY_DN9867_c0_g1_i1.p1 TRINITY_DN9867_c0_g1~~TRINITY_DN9867_c0_g1_i1.p1  ORF type:complete len:801 (+),score=107.41 TRINITY_DN9867_c0_g1_i1:70-2403(+)
MADIPPLLSIRSLENSLPRPSGHIKGKVLVIRTLRQHPKRGDWLQWELRDTEDTKGAADVLVSAFGRYARALSFIENHDRMVVYGFSLEPLPNHLESDLGVQVIIENDATVIVSSSTLPKPDIGVTVGPEHGSGQTPFVQPERLSARRKRTSASAKPASVTANNKRGKPSDAGVNSGFVKASNATQGYRYVTLEQARHLPERSEVNLYAIVTDIRPARATSGTDFLLVLTLYDDAYTGAQMEVTANIFGQQDQLPTIKAVGNIVRFHRVTVQRWNDHLQLLCKLGKGAKAGSIVEFSSNPSHGTDPLWKSSKNHTFTARDDQRIRTLRTFQSNLNLAPVVEHRLLQQLDKEGYYTLMLKVIAVANEDPSDSAPGDLIVWDGSKHPKFILDETHPSYHDPSIEHIRDRAVVIQVWDQHRRWLTTVKPGDIIVAKEVTQASTGALRMQGSRKSACIRVLPSDDKDAIALQERLDEYMELLEDNSLAQDDTQNPITASQWDQLSQEAKLQVEREKARDDNAEPSDKDDVTRPDCTQEDQNVVQPLELETQPRADEGISEELMDTQADAAKAEVGPSIGTVQSTNFVSSVEYRQLDFGSLSRLDPPSSKRVVIQRARCRVLGYKPLQYENFTHARCVKCQTRYCHWLAGNRDKCPKCGSPDRTFVWAFAMQLSEPKSNKVCLARLWQDDAALFLGMQPSNLHHDDQRLEALANKLDGLLKDDQWLDCMLVAYLDRSEVSHSVLRSFLQEGKCMSLRTLQYACLAQFSRARCESRQGSASGL